MEKINSLLVLSLFAGLTACGGSGGGSDDASNNGANNNAGGSTAPVQADTQAPVITVNGDLAIELPFGALYDDDGASALDNVDGDVDVAKEGEVDTFTAGVYDINYTATDVAGNQSQAVRQVTVLGEKVLLQVSSVGQANYELANGTVLPCNDAGSLCSLELDFGETVSVIPNAGADWQFLRWEVCDEIVADQCQVVMTEDKLIAATHLPLAEPVYHDDVIFLTDAQITALVDYDENQNALIFAAGADIAEFQVGSVLVANGDNQFIRRVVDIIELTGAPTIIETAPASLDDVIESGTLIFDVQDESSKLEKNTDKADKKATQKAAQKIAQTTAQNSTASKTLSVPDVELASSADVSVSASGSMGADFQASILVDYSKDRGLTQARILGQAQLETSIGFSVVGEGSVAASQRLDLASFNVASITTPSSPVLIPLMFTVEVEPFVDMAVSGSFSAELSPSVTASLAGSVGAVWDKGYGWTSLQGLKPTITASSGADISAEIGYEVGAGMEVGMELYDFIGPKLTSRVYGGEQARAIPLDDNNCNLELKKYLGFGASLGGELEAFTYTLEINTQPIGYQKLVSVTPTNCDQAIPEGPDEVVATGVGEQAINITWLEATDDVGVVSYQLWRQAELQDYPVKVADTALTEYLDSGLEFATEYCYFVLAVDGVGNTSDVDAQRFNGDCATVLDDDITAPTSPEITALEALTTSSVEVMWSEATDDYGVAGYSLEITPTDSGVAYAAGSTSELALIVQQLNPDAEYCFQVVTYDAAGNVSDPSASQCITMPSASQSQWNMFIGCVGRPFQVEQLVDLNQDVTSNVQVAGSGTDYDGTPLTYLLNGIYSTDGELAADIVWNFEGLSQVRRDRFEADLSGGDSGVVAMDQIQVTGCSAQIQFVTTDQNGTSPDVSKPSYKTESTEKLGPK